MAATRRAEAAEREVVSLQQSLLASKAATTDTSERLSAEHATLDQLRRSYEECETRRAEQELVAQRAIGRVEVLHSELHGKAEALQRLRSLTLPSPDRTLPTPFGTRCRPSAELRGTPIRPLDGPGSPSRSTR